MVYDMSHFVAPLQGRGTVFGMGRIARVAWLTRDSLESDRATVRLGGVCVTGDRHCFSHQART
jgi:hypothetical protein